MSSFEGKNSTEEDAPHIPEMTSSKDLASSNFSQVIFPDISDYFPPGKDVRVTYVLSDAIQPSSRDWVGLFQVGWTSPREYLTFVWSPKLDAAAIDRTVNVTFKAYYLPNDKNEFYQFCFVTKQGQVRGASTPFQFRHQMECDQLVEVEDDTGMIVLKTKTAALEEQLDKITTEKGKLDARVTELKKEKAELENDLEKVKNELKTAQSKNASQEEECMKLRAEMATLNEKLDKVNTSLQKAGTRIEKQKVELDGAAVTIATLTKKFLTLKEEHEKSTEQHEKEISSLNEQLDSKVSKLTETECSLVDLTEKLKNLEMKTTDLQQKNSSMSTEVENTVAKLTREKDDAQAMAKRVKEEKDLFKAQCTNSEEERRKVTQKLKKLEEKLVQKEDEVRVKTEKILAYEEKTKMLKRELTDVRKASSVQKSAMGNQLSNLEDKLNACEASKRLIATELSEARDRRDQLMSELHQVKKDKDRLMREVASSKRQLSELEKNFASTSKRADRLEQRIQEKDGKIAEEKKKSKEQEKELKEQIKLLKSQLESADLAFANAASSAENDRSENGTQTTQMASKSSGSQTKEDIKAKDNVIDELKLQIEDLRTRLSMGAAAYTEKYMECHKLEKKMKKIQDKKTPAKTSENLQQAALPDSTTSDSQDDVNKKNSKRKVPAVKPKEKKGATAGATAFGMKPKKEEATGETTGGNFMTKLEQLFMSIADPDAEEQEQANQLRSKLQDLEKNVQVQHSKYKKYKQLYQDEKKSRSVDFQKHNEELTLAKLELDQLKEEKEFLHNENEALKDQLNEFVKSSHDENVMKTRETHDQTFAPPSDASIDRSQGGENLASSAHSAPKKEPTELKYGNPYLRESIVITRGADGSDSDGSGEFHLANSGFSPLSGLCPKNLSSEDSDGIEISRPPIDILPSGSTVINRQPIRSPPLIEVISDETTSDDLSSSPPSYDQDAVAAAYNSRNSGSGVAADKPSGGARRRRTGKSRKKNSRKSYA